MNPLTVQQALASEPMDQITKDDCYAAFNWVYSRLDENNPEHIDCLFEMDDAMQMPGDYFPSSATLFAANCLDLVIPEKLMAPIHAEANARLGKPEQDIDVYDKYLINEYQTYLSKAN
ncbi:hypothetical protein [Actinomyces vulturis]|uniref:hypothetical protein n=1 Tax=Actinomyces vulturis TaxID=1857645 RepID=UPI00083730D0|nr:hypothetical protein [Actinomyces vulturis]